MKRVLPYQGGEIIRIVKTLLQWIKSNRVMLVNSGSLVGTTAVTSILGFAYWWLAARQFPLEAVGIASASVSTMMLLGSLCLLGLGTLLITELPRQPGQEGSLISTALVVVGGFGGGIGILFAIFAPCVSAEFNPLKASTIDIIIFAVGVSFTSITLVLDQALIGILHGSLQLWRNTFFAVAKLILLFVIGLYLSQKTGITIYMAWAIGSGLSLVALLGFALRKRGGFRKANFPQWGLLRKLGPAAIQHHLLNLTLQAPTQALPILVTVLLSAKMNAWFYVSWMIASFIFMVPTALTMVLHAMNSAQQSSLRYKARVTIGVALVISLLAICLLLVASKQVLGLFGSSYAEQATWCLRILALATFPLIIKNHYISICRIQDRIVNAMLGMLPGGVLELVAAALGAHLGGLFGLSLGWVIALVAEAIFMFHTVYKAIRPVNSSLHVSRQENFIEPGEISLIDTTILAAIPPHYIATAPVAAYLGYLETRPMRSIQQHEGNDCRARSRLRRTQLERYPSYHEDMHTTSTEQTSACRAK